MRKLPLGCVRWGRAAIVLAVTVTGVTATACASSGSDEAQPTWPRCFALTEGDSVATIRIEPRDAMDEPDAGQVTIYSIIAGEEEFPPETTAGRLTLNSFVYADGTTLTFDDQQLTWPVDSLLEGAVFTATACP